MRNRDLIDVVSSYLALWGRKPDDEVVSAYVLVLRELDGAQLQEAFVKAAKFDDPFPLAAGQLYALARGTRSPTKDARLSREKAEWEAHKRLCAQELLERNKETVA